MTVFHPQTNNRPSRSHGTCLEQACAGRSVVVFVKYLDISPTYQTTSLAFDLHFSPLHELQVSFIGTVTQLFKERFTPETSPIQ